MVRATTPLTEFAAWQVPIHADPAREYHWVVQWETWKRDGSTVTFDARDEEGQALIVCLRFVDPAVLRVQLLTPGASAPPPSALLVQHPWPPVTLATEETERGLRLRTPALVVEVDRAPWQLRVSFAGRPLYRQEIADWAFDKPQSFPFGYSVRADGSIATHETFALEVGEHLYGLGGQYGPFDKRGQRHITWLREAYGTNTTPVSYVETPFLVSSRGYGLFLNQSERSTWELGYPSTVAGSVQVQAPTLEYFLIAGPDPKTILRRYTALTGRPALPPLWSLGLWMSRCMYQNRAEVEEVVNGMRTRDIPLDVIHLDPRWLRSRRTRAIDACDFEWDEAAFGDPDALIAWLRERGVRLSLWENPYLWDDCTLYAEAAAKGYLVPGPDGKPALSMDPGNPAAVIDYTNPAAVEWVKEKHRYWLRKGVACFKTDYGEAAPATGVYANGMRGDQVHNLFPLLYNRAVFEVTEEVHGTGNALVFGRSGTAGSQRYPLAWAGDSQSTWGGMAGALRCGLSQAMSGVAFWTSDTGGFHTPPGFGRTDDPVIYIRWAQWGLLCSHSRFHGLGPREPWAFGEEAVRVVRAFAQLRYRLLPYLWGLAHEASETGIPVLRPLVLEYPDDPVAPYIETQYLLGPDLLVCPVFNAEGKVRVYLPPGRWHDWWDGVVHEGPCHLDLTVPLDRMPLFVRDATVLPLAPVMAHTEAAPWDPIELQVRGEALAHLMLWTPDGQRIPVRAVRRHNRLNVRIENATQRWRVRLVGVTAQDATLTGAAIGLAWQKDGADTVAEFEMTGQGSAQCTALLG